MKAAVINPYLDTLGGGERYTMGIVRALLSKNYKVHIEWQSEDIKEKLETRFGIDLTEAKIVNDTNRGDGYDVCFWVSDGSIPLLRARKNFLHFQVPFKNIGGKSLINKMKLFRVSNILCNSQFTKSVIDKEFGVKSNVLYPPVDVHEFKSKKKENIILFVGRFSALLQSKRQDILVDAFKKLPKSILANWKLVLVGGTEIGGDKLIKKLEKLSKNYPVEIIQSPDFKTLKTIYGKAKIFWSASGYGVDENKYPNKVEHFGITVVEAMAAKCVPIVFNSGGHKEIVKNKNNGFSWETRDDLTSKTQNLITNNKLLREISNKAQLDSKNFSYEKFQKTFTKLL